MNNASKSLTSLDISHAIKTSIMPHHSKSISFHTVMSTWMKLYKIL